MPKHRRIRLPLSQKHTDLDSQILNDIIHLNIRLVPPERFFELRRNRFYAVESRKHTFFLVNVQLAESSKTTVCCTCLTSQLTS